MPIQKRYCPFSNKKLRTGKTSAKPLKRRKDHILDPTCGMNLHFLHFVRIQLFLDPLRQCRRQSTPCRWFTAPIIHRCRKRIVHGQVARKRQTLAWRRSRPMCQSRSSIAYCRQYWRRRIRVTKHGFFWSMRM